MSQNPFVLALAALVFIGPLVRGLFFSPEQLMAAGFVFVVALLWTVNRQRQGRPVYRAWSLLEIGALLLPIAYGVAYVRAVHPHAALLGWVGAAAAYGVFLIAREAPLSGRRGRTLLSAAIAGGAVVAAVGMLSYLNLVRLPGAVTLPWKADPSVGRVGSTFQYYNALAAYMGAMVVLSLGVQDATGPWWRTAPWRAAAGAMAVVMALTQSRGAFLVLPLAAVVLVALSPRGRHLQTLAEFAGVALGALLTLAPITEAARAGQPLLALCWFLVAALVAAGPWGSQLGPVRRFGSVLRPLAAMGMIVLVVGAVVYGHVVETPVAARLTTSAAAAIDAVQGETPPPSDQIERWLYVQDAWRMFRERPLLGGGAGAWASLFARYRSLPYYTTQVHSYYAQVAIETGAVGLAALALFLIGVIISGVRVLRVRRGGAERLQLAGGLAALFLLLAHAAADFDLSFLSIAFLVSVLAGSLHGDARRLSAEEREGDIEAAERRLLAGSASGAKHAETVARRLAAGSPPVRRRWASAFLIAEFLTFAGIIVALLSSQAFVYWAGVRRASGRLDSAQRNYTRALRFNPRDDAIYLAVSELLLREAADVQVTDPLNQQLRQDLIEQAVRNAQHASNLNPQDPYVGASLARAYLTAGRSDEALAEAQRLKEGDPWGTLGYEISARVDVGLALAALQRGDKAVARVEFGEALQEAAAVQAKADRFAHLPLRFGRSPQVVGRMALAIGQAHYFFRNTKEAEKYLQLAGRDATVTPDSEPWLAVLYRSTGPRGKDAWLQRRPWVRQAFQDEKFLQLAALPQL